MAARRGGSRPNMSWEFFDLGATIAAASTKALLGTSVPNNAGLDLTIRRTRGTFGVATDNLAAVAESQRGAFGMGLVSTDAAAAGVGSVPGPVSDAEWPGWFVWIPFVEGFITATAIGQQANFVRRYEVDSKAQRIFDGVNMSLIFVVESDSASDGFTFDVILRVLTHLRGTR